MEWSPQTVFGAQRVNMQRTAWILILEDFSQYLDTLLLSSPQKFSIFFKKNGR